MRASSWENASKHCTSALKLAPKMSPIEELRARYLRTYANVKVLIETTEAQEQYQAAGVGVGAVREKVRDGLLSELEKDTGRIKDLPLLCPQLLDDAHAKSVLEAEDMRRKAREVLLRYTALQPSVSVSGGVDGGGSGDSNSSSGSDKSIRIAEKRRRQLRRKSAQHLLRLAHRVILPLPLPLPLPLTFPRRLIQAKACHPKSPPNPLKRAVLPACLFLFTSRRRCP
jgi:hypothetical protein